jgi:GNAT superfamily N-acetyltransferase
MPGHIRTARIEEHEDLFRLGYDAWGDGAPMAEYLAGCRASPKYAQGRWLVLHEGGALLSALIVYRLRPGCAGLGSVATAPDARGRGAASRLLAGALTLLEADGDHTFFLFADTAPELYQRQGFVPLPAEFQRRQGSICMVRAARPEQLWADLGFSPPQYF